MIKIQKYLRKISFRKISSKWMEKNLYLKNFFLKSSSNKDSFPSIWKVENSHKCDLCQKSFSNVGILNSHIKVHLNERLIEIQNQKNVEKSDNLNWSYQSQNFSYMWRVWKNIR